MAARPIPLALLVLGLSVLAGCDETTAGAGSGAPHPLVGSVWDLRVRFVANDNQNADEPDEVPRWRFWRHSWETRFRVDRDWGDQMLFDLTTRYESLVRAAGVQGWDQPDYWASCTSCSAAVEWTGTGTEIFGGNLLESSASIEEVWEGLEKELPFLSSDLNFSRPDQPAFLISVHNLALPDEVLARLGCSAACEHTTYYDGDAPPRVWRHDEYRGPGRGIFIFAVSPVDQVVRLTDGPYQLTIRLRCVEGCNAVDCRDGCDDGNDCTEDRCVVGTGCVFEPRSGSCRRDACMTGGTCEAGACVGGTPESCDDGNECTTDLCDPEFGCVALEDDRPLDNPVPDDCVQTICLGGDVFAEAPADDEKPPQAGAADCVTEVCWGGDVWSLPDDTEVPPQNAPDDCEIQLCFDGGVDNWDDYDEPGCR